MTPSGQVGNINPNPDRTDQVALQCSCQQQGKQTVRLSPNSSSPKHPAENEDRNHLQALTPTHSLTCPRGPIQHFMTCLFCLSDQVATI